MDALEALAQIIPPPTHSVYIGSDLEWQVVERILEMMLPVDFKKLINLYGTGCFLKFLYPLSPFAPFETSLNLLSGATKQRLAAYRSGREDFPQYTPAYPAYPHASGLFPWGITVNGDTLFWLRQGEPEKWPTVVCDSKFTKEGCYRFDMTATEFLYRLLSREIETEAFPEGFPGDLHDREDLFTAYRNTNPEKSHGTATH